MNLIRKSNKILNKEINEKSNNLTILEIAHNNGIDIEGACEGSLACSTCHIIVDKDTEIDIGGTKYKQRRLVNWLMLNIANSIMEINWSVYEEEELEIVERHLDSWRDIGFLDALKWYGATAEFEIYFLNKR